MHSPPDARRQARRWAPLAIAALGSAALAAPANAEVIAPHVLDVTYNTSDVFLGDYPAGTAEVAVTRGGVQIAAGTANLVADETGVAEGGINNDHVAATDCWAGYTPQLLPGDVVTVITAEGTDTHVIQGVTAERAVLEGDDLVVRGFAATPGGDALDPTALDAQLHAAGGSFSAGSSGDTFLSASGGDLGGRVSYDAATKRYEARWTGLSASDRAIALEGETLGAFAPEVEVEPHGAEGTYYKADATAGPLAACADTAPYAPNEASDLGRGIVNATNAGQPMTIAGKAQPGVTRVAVSLTDDNGKATAPVNVSLGGGDAPQTWTATVPAADVQGLADGRLRVSTRFTTADGTFAGAGRSIAKDTVAPAAPTANVASGTFPGPVDVVLGGEGVLYTTDGSEPNGGSTAYTRPIRVGASQTIKAIAIDAAGNASPVTQLDLAIAQASTAPIVAPIVPSVSAPPRLRLQSLTVSRRMKLASARRRGVRALIFAPQGAKAVRVRLRLGRRTVASVVRRVTGDGVLQVVLPRTARQRRSLKRGLYTLQITPGTSTTRLDGETTVRRMRIVR
jgi:hypothetical protein